MDAKKLASLFDNPNFKKFSGGAPIVSAGEPYSGGPVVFRVAHGSRSTRPFDTFDLKKSTDNSLGRGIYSTDVTDLADAYGSTGHTIHGLAAFKNPFFMDWSTDAGREASEAAGKAVGLDIRGGLWINGDKKEIAKKLKKAGYDGVIVSHPGQFDGFPAHREVVSFEPTQFKSINNEGTFDPTNPNIYKSALPYAVAGGGLMSALAPQDAAAIDRIRQNDAPLQDAWNPVEAFGGGLGGGVKAALGGVIPDGVMDWAMGLMSGGK